MESRLKALEEKAKSEIKKADSIKVLEKARIHYLGKKGELTKILRGMGAIDAAERPRVGRIANTVRDRKSVV